MMVEGIRTAKGAKIISMDEHSIELDFLVGTYIKDAFRTAMDIQSRSVQDVCFNFNGFHYCVQAKSLSELMNEVHMNCSKVTSDAD